MIMVRKNDSICQTAPRPIMSRDYTAMQHHDIFDNRQAKACAAGIPRASLVYSIKTLKNTWQMFSRYTAAVVANRKYCFSFPG